MVPALSGFITPRARFRDASFARESLSLEPRLSELLRPRAMCRLATLVFRSGRRLGQVAVAPFKLESIIYYKGIHLAVRARELALDPRLQIPRRNIRSDCCFAWNTLINQLWKIMPVGMYDWVNRSQLMALGIRSLCLPLRKPDFLDVGYLSAATPQAAAPSRRFFKSAFRHPDAGDVDETPSSDTAPFSSLGGISHRR